MASLQSDQTVLLPQSCGCLRQVFGVAPDLVADIKWPDVQQALCKLSTPVATVVLNTWGNGWPTSVRMHADELRPCLFGCAVP